MPRNIELKAVLPDLDAARAIAERLATEHLGRQHQLDTYFHTSRGRLKLREIDGSKAQLIWYARPDIEGAKGSDYQIHAVDDGPSLRALLSAALGVRVSVEKQRQIYLCDNVRIHLDRVVELGTFLEFEAVLPSAASDAQGFQQVEQLQRAFGIGPQQRVSGSYADLMLARLGKQ